MAGDVIPHLLCEWSLSIFWTDPTLNWVGSMYRNMLVLMKTNENWGHKIGFSATQSVQTNENLGRVYWVRLVGPVPNLNYALNSTFLF